MSGSDRKVGIAQRPTRNVSAERTLGPELDNYLSVVGGMWWEDNDLHLAHTDEDWGEGLPDSSWYVEEVDHMTRSG